eukprot:TRINITY_DN114916_c0_g1_i1.p1 TRINITY_DN114916_c0_g1~~TRINITY_DN114916_c0_g1_i1.p1  ORF type:complete len:166 (+),score=30.48 TRINITY_DN114916_c0_g1_i1:42-539(+)
MGSGASTGPGHGSAKGTKDDKSCSGAIASSSNDAAEDAEVARAKTKAFRAAQIDAEINVPGSRQITVTLVRKGKYGMKLAQKGGRLWRIVEILPDGTVAEFNKANPDSVVREDDLIFKLNGEDAEIKVLEGAEEGSTVEVTLVRVPRSIAPPPCPAGVGSRTASY